MNDTKDNLIEKIKEAENLLSSAKCPDCDGSGVLIKEVTKTGVRWIDDGHGNPLPEPIPIQDFEQSQCFWCYHKDKFLSEIAALEEQESKPVYDEAYLNECIAKAKPRLSKIKDIDKEMNEIKGIEEQGSADNIKDLLREYGVYGINHNEDANNKLIEALINLIDSERRAIIKALEEYANQFKTK